MGCSAYNLRHTNLYGRVMPEEHGHVGDDALLIWRSAQQVCGGEKKVSLVTALQRQWRFTKHHSTIYHHSCCFFFEGGVKPLTGFQQKDPLQCPCSLSNYLRTPAVVEYPDSDEQFRRPSQCSVSDHETNCPSDRPGPGLWT